MINDTFKIGIEGKCLFNESNGLSNYTYNLIKGLCNIDKENRYIVWYSKSHLFKKSILDFKQHNLIQKRYFFEFLFDKNLDIYHDTGSFSMVLPEAKEKIFTVRNLKNRFNKIKKEILLNSRFIIASSNSIKEELVKNFNFNEDKIKVVYEAANDCFVSQPKSIAMLAKTKYSIKRPFILTIGSFNEEKNNYFTLLKSYSFLKFESPPDLVIIDKNGNNSLEINKIAKKLDILNNVKHLTCLSKKDMACLLSECEIFVCPRLYDGNALVLLEAMSCGAPIISSNNSAMEEIAGNNAILTDPTNPEKIANSIRKILSSETLKNDLKKKSLSTSSNFTLQKMAKETYNIYREALNK